MEGRKKFEKRWFFSLWGNRATTHTHIIYCTIFPFLAPQQQQQKDDLTHIILADFLLFAQFFIKNYLTLWQNSQKNARLIHLPEKLKLNILDITKAKHDTSKLDKYSCFVTECTYYFNVCRQSQGRRSILPLFFGLHCWLTQNRKLCAKINALYGEFECVLVNCVKAWMFI